MTRQDWQGQLKKIQLSKADPNSKTQKSKTDSGQLASTSCTKRQNSNRKPVSSENHQELSNEELFNQAVEEIDGQKSAILAKYSLNEPLLSGDGKPEPFPQDSASRQEPQSDVNVSDQNLFLDAFADVTEASWRKSKQASSKLAQSTQVGAEQRIAHTKDDVTDLDLRSVTLEKATQLLADLLDRSARLQAKTVSVEYDDKNRAGIKDLLSAMSVVRTYTEKRGSDRHQWVCLIDLE